MLNVINTGYTGITPCDRSFEVFLARFPYTNPVGASQLAKKPRPPRGTCQPASSLTIIASKLAPTVGQNRFMPYERSGSLSASRDSRQHPSQLSGGHRTLRSHVGRFSAGNRRQRGALPGGPCRRVVDQHAETAFVGIGAVAQQPGLCRSHQGAGGAQSFQGHSRAAPGPGETGRTLAASAPGTGGQLSGARSADRQGHRRPTGFAAGQARHGPDPVGLLAWLSQ
ncbi:hypothetical protein D3C76_957170 [compost metagenome]